MTISGKTLTAVLLLFFLFAAPTSTENNSPVITSDDQSYPVNSPIEFRNPKFNSTDYYSAELRKISWIYLVISFVYLADLAMWISVCFKVKPSLKRIHFFMAGLIILKIVSLICAVGDGSFDNVTGSLNSSHLMFYMNHSISVLRLLIVILLIRNGWPLVKQCLKEIDVMVIAILVTCQVSGNVGSIMIGATGDEDIWKAIIIVANMFTACAVTVSCISSMILIGQLADWISSRLQLVRFFYMMITIYLMLTSIFTMKKTDFHSEPNPIEAFNHTLKGKLYVEVLGLMFYKGIFKMFKEYFEKDE